MAESSGFELAIGQERDDRVLDRALVFIGDEIDDHIAFGPLGSPSTRSPMVLRRISDVPPPIAHLKHSRKCAG